MMKHSTRKAAKLGALQELKGVLHELHGQRMAKRKAKPPVDAEEPGEGTPEEENAPDEETETADVMGKHGGEMDVTTPSLHVRKFGKIRKKV